MKDRVLVGFIAGITAAIGTGIASWLFYSMGLTDIRFLDWASRMFLGYLPNTAAETIVTQIVQIIWDGLMGTLFVMLIPKTGSKHLIYKGIMFSFALLFVFRGIVVVFNVEPLNTTSLMSFVLNTVCSLIWGLLAALVIKKSYLNDPHDIEH